MKLGKFIKSVGYNLLSAKILADIPDAIVVVNKRGLVRYANDRAKQMLCITDCSDISSINGLMENGMTDIWKSCSTKTPVLTNITTINGSFSAEITVSENILGYCLCIRDLTSLTNMINNEEKIAKFNFEKNAMISKLEHDFKAPLTSITGFSRGLIGGLGGDLTEKQAKYINIITSSAEEYYHFIDKFIEFSNAESSLYTPEYKKFDVIQELKTIAAEFEKCRLDKTLGFDFNYESFSKRAVKTDKKAFDRIIRNVIDVSTNMTDKGYLVMNLSVPTLVNADKLGFSISEQQLESCIHISINDTSKGMTEDEIKIACEPYAQLDANKKDYLRALKLGTASILIKRLNGQFSISSKEDKGVQYDIIIPIEKDTNE